MEKLIDFRHDSCTPDLHSICSYDTLVFAPRWRYIILRPLRLSSESCQSGKKTELQQIEREKCTRNSCIYDQSKLCRPKSTFRRIAPWPLCDAFCVSVHLALPPDSKDSPVFVSISKKPSSLFYFQGFVRPVYRLS